MWGRLAWITPSMDVPENPDFKALCACSSDTAVNSNTHPKALFATVQWNKASKTAGKLLHIHMAMTLQQIDLLKRFQLSPFYVF